jgi:hypothetical protein
MAEIASYIYVVGPLAWAVLAGFGGLIVTLPPPFAIGPRIFCFLHPSALRGTYYNWMRG